MGYTWEEVMLNIDVKAEAKKEQEQQQDIQAKQLKEQEAASMWGLGLSLIGGALFGPPGYFAGKKAGEFGADYVYDWESERVDPGKYYREDAKKFNKTIAEAASDQTKGQVLNAVMDLATMYVQAGGLQEGFDPTIGGGDWTTFGTGDAAWSVFGREVDPFTGSSWASEGAGGMVHPVTGKAIGSAPMPTGTPDIPGLFSGGFKKAGERVKEAYNVSPIDKLLEG